MAALKKYHDVQGNTFFLFSFVEAMRLAGEWNLSAEDEETATSQRKPEVNVD